MPRSKQRSKGTGSIYRNSRGQWVAAIEAGWTARGTRRRITFKARTEAEVRARLDKVQQRIAVEGNSVSFATITMKRWAEQWLAQRQRIVRPGTFVSDCSAVRRWIIPTVGHLRLDSLQPSDVRRVAMAQEAKGLALATMQRTHAVLSKLLTDAVSDGYQVCQRARETARPGQGESPRQALRVSDAMAILGVCEDRPDASRWVAALVEGLRPAEALGLTWDMIDFQAEAPPSPHGLVWPRDDGSPRSAEFDRRQWYDIVGRAGVTVTLPDARKRRPLLYEARHTAATLLLPSGVDETTIKAILGHSSVLSTQSYLHTDRTRTRSALVASAALLGLDR